MKKIPLILLAVFGTITVNSAHSDSAKLTNPANGHSYQRFDVAKTWSQAKDACANQGGYLATITSQAENDWIVKNSLQGTSNSTRLGGSDEQIEGTWIWITGESFVYTNWNSGEPNSGYGGYEEDSLFFNADGTWNDGSSNVAASSYLCEWNSSNPALKLSWKIPALHYCSANRLNGTNTLTSETCFNNIQGATVKAFAVSVRSRMTIFVNPTNQTGSFFFKMTFPSELKISSVNIINSEPIPRQESSEVADILSLIGSEVAGEIFGLLSVPVELLAPQTAGDPSFLELLGTNSVLSKQLYPYQTIERHFQRPSPSVSMTIVVDSDISFTKFKTLMDK
ncbi:MAG: C-type lectin domain-containing protein [Rhodocyclaceae bacterium]|nr:C-type lectin domain-containing protein [Rhodocyclaceae bacterium]